VLWAGMMDGKAYPTHRSGLRLSTRSATND